MDIIGGHIDYNLYSLCSAAIDRDVILACSRTESDQPDADQLVINDMDGQANEYKLSTDPKQKLLNEKGTTNYIQFGYKSIMLAKKAEGKKPMGLKILIDYNFPKDPDLAWGAALTVSTMIAIAKAHDLLDHFSPEYLSTLNINAMKASGFGGRQMD